MSANPTEAPVQEENLERAGALIHNEVFLQTIKDGLNAHIQTFIPREDGIEFTQEPEDQRRCLELATIQALLESQQLAVQRVSTKGHSTFICAAERDTVMKITSYRETDGSYKQLNVAIMHPSTDPYRQGPEAIVVDTPHTVVRVRTETIQFDDRRVRRPKPGMGISIAFYTGGRAEVFGTNDAEGTRYTSEEPILTIDDENLDFLQELLQF